MVSGLKGTTYLDRLKEVGLTTLEARRARGDMLLTWRSQSGNLSIPSNEWFTPVEPPEQMSTRHSSSEGMLVKPQCHLDVRRNFFTVRSVDPWNALPTSIKNSATINIFKEAYDKHTK